MKAITVYTFEDIDGGEDSYSTQDYPEARDRAMKYGLRIIGHEYEWSDSELIADYTDPALVVTP